jgi:glyoxylase-like metal-dependent hydrolase (beta-lactamase superfamily II)
MNKWMKVIGMLIGVGIILVACSSEPEQIEVTRIVEVEVPGEDVEVEVTRIVEVEAPGEDVEVEVTRIVEVEVPAATDSGEETTDSGEETNDEEVSEPSFETVEVADGIYSFGNGEAFGAFMVTDEGVVVMDSINPDFAAGMLAAIRGVTDQPIELLIYSHNHWDHIAGGQVFKDEGVTVLSHIDTHEWLVDHPAPNPAVVIPDETWAGERHDVVLGGRTVELYHFGVSHGEGMTVFRFPEEQTIFTVDLVVPERVGFAYMPDFSPRGWIATLKAMEELEYETVMFAHNAAFGPRSSVTEQREFLEDLTAELLAMMARGENPFAVFGNPNAIELPKYQDWAGYDMWLGLNAQRILLEMIMGH